MKLAVIADIHANHIALEAALNNIDEIRPEAIIFLGDYITDCPYPQKTMKLLYECQNRYPCYFIRGNREDYLIEHHHNPNDGWNYTSSCGTLLYTYENLSQSDIEFFESLPICTDISIENYPVITACHGSPENTREWIKGKDDLIDKYSKSISGDYLLCGHTHRSEIAHANGKEIIFCTSLGLPSDHGTNIRLTTLEYVDNKWKCDMLPIDFDRERLIKEFDESGLLEKSKIWGKSIIMMIREEIEYPGKCVHLAWEKAIADNYSGGGILPEKYWEEAAKELGIV